MNWVPTIAAIFASAILLVALILLIRSRKHQHLISRKRDKQHQDLRRALHEAIEKDTEAREQEKRLRAMMNASQDALLAFHADADGMPENFFDCNLNACELLGYSYEDLLLKNVADIELVSEPGRNRMLGTEIDLISLSNSEQMAENSPYVSNSLKRQIIEAMHSENPLVIEKNIVHRTGKRIPVSITITHLGSPSGQRTIIIYGIHDCSSVKALNKNNRQIQQDLDDLKDSLSIGIAEYDADRRLTYVNNSLLRTFGCPSKDEFKVINLLNDEFIPDQMRSQINRGEDTAQEIMIDFDKLIDSHQFVTSRVRKASFEIMVHNLGKDRHQVTKGYRVQVIDRTELREGESALALREAQLRQARKMQAIGTMTGGIAHDFNNILTPILGYAEISEDFCDDNPRIKEFIAEIKTATLRAKELVSQILVFSRQADEAPNRIHLTSIIKEVAKQQNAVLSPDIMVTANIRTEEDLVLANPTQIHQVLTNFATNSAHAMKENGGTLSLALSTFSMGWRHRHEFPQLKKGRYVRITVKDNGPGIPDSIRDQVFNPFFSTKPAGEGTGMGLAVVKGIVDGLGGAIALETSEGEGTAFHVALPLMVDDKEERPVTTHQMKAEGQRILFIDDEDSITKMAGTLLESLGYQPQTCSSPTEALERVKQTPEFFDLIITDQVMPEIVGTELVKRIHEINPKLPAIICTGFPSRLSKPEIEQAKVAGVVNKPVTRQDLASAISSALKWNI